MGGSIEEREVGVAVELCIAGSGHLSNYIEHMFAPHEVLKPMP
jgi:hypothetical protein